MARETKEERLARQQQEQAAAEEALAKYRATIPGRLMTATALANNLGVSTTVSLTERGPKVQFYRDRDDQLCMLDEYITYDTEEWQLDSLERSLQMLQEAQAARAARRALAQAVFDTLTADQKVAVKENIYLLR